MTSNCRASAGTTGSHDWRESPSPCKSTRGAPAPERLKAIGVMPFSLGGVLRAGL